MQYPPAPYDPVLAEARALLARRDFNAARVLLKAVVSRNPNNNEALLLLLRVEEEQSRANIDVDTSLWSPPISRRSYRAISSVIFGLLFFAAGIIRLNDVRNVGLNGSLPERGKSGLVRMVSGKEALATGLIAVTVGAGLFTYGIRNFRLK